MNEDNFSQWLQGFIENMIEYGMPARQADKFRGEYLSDARRYFNAGVTCEDAAVREFFP